MFIPDEQPACPDCGTHLPFVEPTFSPEGLLVCTTCGYEWPGVVEIYQLIQYTDGIPIPKNIVIIPVSAENPDGDTSST